VIVHLLRHGVAEEWNACGDAARALTEDGVVRLQRAVPGWRKVAHPIQRVHVSPLLRAQQTGRIFRDAVAKDAEWCDTEALVPEASPMLAYELLQCALQEGVDGIACVAHEPLLGSLLGLLLCGSPRSAIPFKKGMLVVVDIESSAAMTGRLVAALSQKAAAGL
jgi:phosphohistidine phosphatase